MQDISYATHRLRISPLEVTYKTVDFRFAVFIVKKRALVL